MKHLLIFLLSISLIGACSNPTSPNEQSGSNADTSVSLFTEPIGVQTYSFRNSFPNGIEATLDTIAGMGIELVEGNPPGDMAPEEFVRLCEERGMKVVSTGAGFDELETDPQSVLDRAMQMGVEYVMCAWIPHERANFSKEDANRAINVFENAGRMLKENDITLCYHVHGYEFQPDGEATLMEYMIENSDPDLVSFEMDILWVHFGGGDPADLLRKYPDRWKLMHLKDLKKGTPKDLTGGTDVENDVVLGTGELNIPDILRAAKEVGVAYYFIEDESSRVTQQIPASIEYLRSLKGQ